MKDAAVSLPRACVCSQFSSFFLTAGALRENRSDRPTDEKVIKNPGSRRRPCKQGVSYPLPRVQGFSLSFVYLESADGTFGTFSELNLLSSYLRYYRCLICTFFVQKETENEVAIQFANDPTAMRRGEDQPKHRMLAALRLLGFGSSRFEGLSTCSLISTVELIKRKITVTY